MKILLIGYGKMGKAIEKIALDKGHIISGIVGEGDRIEEVDASKHDVAIEFTQPESAVNNISTCIEKGIPIVSGTTGWTEQLETIESMCQEKDGTFFYASNFSLGVNLFFMLNEYVAKLMGTYGKGYQVSIDETHHTEKKDAPSGTAISIAEGINRNHTTLKHWHKATSKSSSIVNSIPIESFRKANVPGTHVVSYNSDIDQIELKHTAHSRQGFALGAVIAAEWVKDKKGVLGMKDLLSEPEVSKF